jgi:ferric-dicitrate binding protein FerR (iron transport regulator)
MEKYQAYEVEDLVLDNEFIRWVRFPSKTQDEKWDQFLTEHPEKMADVEKAKSIIRSLEPAEESVPSERLESVWQAISDSRRIRYIGLSRQLFRYAAVFIFAFLLGWGSFQLFPDRKTNFSEVYNEVRVPYGERSEMTLYDGTKVWLNSGTELRFPLVFHANQRKVFIKGEAFFDVAENKEKPFIVNAGQMDIKVLGTRFNVCAYPDDQEFYATLEKGKILAINSQTGEEINLTPGTQATLNLGSQKFTLQDVDTRLYTSWKENMLQFENAPFSEVIKKMERWYDVKIHIDHEINTGERYTMTIKTESLREMLRLVSFTTPITYEIKGNQVFIQ